MNDRHEVIQDKEFWLRLEFGLSGWFHTCDDEALGGYWCDGFIPEQVANSRAGVVVTGTAWIADGKNSQHKCSFVAAIPQKMLARRRDAIAITELALDIQRKLLRFSVAPAAESPNKSLDRTREG